MLNKKKLNIFELRFNEEGASLEDLISMNLYSDMVDINYYYLSNEPLKRNIHPFLAKQIKYNGFFSKIMNIRKAMKEIPKNEIIYVTSTSYLFLLLILLFTKRDDNIYLLIHFIPYKNKWLHKFCIKIIMKIVTKATVPNEFVYESVTNELPEIKNKLNVLYTHTLKNKNNISKIKNTFLILLGSSLVDSQKLIIESLNFSQFKNLKFTIVTKVPLKIKKYENVKVINKYVSNEKYNRLLNESESILLNYNIEYSSRYSKMIYDSIEYNIKIVTNYLGSNYLSKQYDEFFNYANKGELIKILDSFNKGKFFHTPDNSKFIAAYSNEIRLKMFKKIFKG